MSAVLRLPPLSDWYFTVKSAVSVAASRPGVRTRPMSKPSVNPGELVNALESNVDVIVPEPVAGALWGTAAAAALLAGRRRRRGGQAALSGN